MFKRFFKRNYNEGESFVLTFTKKWVGRILVCGIIWITMSYILAFMGREVIAEELSSTVASVIIATILGYLLKAFFETYCEKKNEMVVAAQ